MKIYSNKEFSQLPEFFLRNEQVVPDGFESLYERFTTRRDQSKGIDESDESSSEPKKSSCNYSYRLSKSKQCGLGVFTDLSFVVCFSVRAQPRPLYFVADTEGACCFLDRAYLEGYLICSTAREGCGSTVGQD